MHELSVTQSVLQIALRHATEEQHITDIYLVIGQLSSMVDDSVQFYWDIISDGTAAQGAQLHFKRVPAEMQCRNCDKQYRLGENTFSCPNCGSSAVYLVSGGEFYVEAIEVEMDQVGQEQVQG